MAGFLQARDFTLSKEGGFTIDQGGPTYHGIRLDLYNEWRKKKGMAPLDDIRKITPDEEDAYYFPEYWVAAHCTGLPWPLSLIQFDASVNSGPVRAIKILQRALGNVEVDGLWGKETSDALMVADTTGLYNSMLWERQEFWRVLCRTKPQTYSKADFFGWSSRLLDLRAKARATW